MAAEEEIIEAVDAARGAGCKELVLLHCISSYPAPMDQANLRQIPEIAKRLDVLAEHTMGTTASVATIPLGACLIEKHFTLSHADKGSVSSSALEPAVQGIYVQ